MHQVILRAINRYLRLNAKVFATLVLLAFCLRGEPAFAQQSTPELATLERQAESGDQFAQLELGRRYIQGGRNLPGRMDYSKESVDYSKAAVLFRKSAEQGNADAEAELAGAYERGYGICQDSVQSVFWARKAANQGNLKGQYEIGSAHMFGHGVPQDFAEARKWYQKAVDGGGKPIFLENLEKYVADGHPPGHNDDLHSVPEPDGPCLLSSITVGERARSGDAAAQAVVAEMSAQTKSTSANIVAQIRQSAEGGDVAKQAQLGDILINGEYGEPKDYVQAIAWYRKAAAQGNPDAAWGMGSAFESGKGVPKDLTQALVWYRRSGNIGADEVARLTPVQPEVGPDNAVPTAPLVTDRRQEITDKIEELQSDIEEHETAAENWNNTVQQLSSSGCAGVGAALCESIGQVGVAKAQANRNKELNEAAADRAEISRLQGEAAATAAPLDQSLSGNLAQVTLDSGTGSRNAAANPQALAIQRQLGSSPDMSQAFRNAGGRKGCWNGKYGADSGVIPGSETWGACPGY